MRNVRRKQVRDKRKKRRLVYITCSILFFVYITMDMIIGDNGLLKYLQLKSVRETLLEETLVMKSQNEEAKNRIEAMKKDPGRVEELAREYGLTKKGELIFKFDRLE